MIRLTNDLYMDADENCYIMGRPRQSRGNRLELRNPTYHSTAAQAVSAALSHTLRKGVADGTITTLRRFIQEQERQRTELQKLIAPLDA